MASNLFYASTPIQTSTNANWEIGGIGGYNDAAWHEMLLMAIPDSSASTLVLNWRYGVEKPDIYRRNAGSTDWGSPIVTASLPRRLTNSVTAGQRYEYKVGGRFLYSAVGAPPIHNRGKVILVVDQTWTNSIEPDLLVLKTNLVGEGWTVIRTNVPPHNDTNWLANTNAIAQIKSFIVGQYNADPANTKTVFLIGHVPTPYSGLANSDNHGDHFGAWTADGYYGSTNATVTGTNGDTSTQWTDKSVNYDSSTDDDNDNSIGDGKWDNDFFPADAAGKRIHLAVSRVDFAELVSFFNPSNGATPKAEPQLLSQYLQKDNKYRLKQIAFPSRAVVGGYFGGDQAGNDRFIYRNALENSSRWFGLNAGVMTNGDFLNEPLLFFSGLLAGSGGHFYITALGIHTNGEHWTADLALSQYEPKGAIYMLHGSFFSDFLRRTDNFYRATLATGNYGLIAVANSELNAYPQWKFEPAGLDEPFGTGIMRTINEAGASAQRWLGMQGDPTLRVHVLAPPSNLRTNGVSNAILIWNASSEASQYYVYRSTNNLAGPFDLQSGGPVNGTTWTDNSPPPGAKMYMVRATKLTVTGSGSFNNLSQGTFANVN